MLKTNKKILLVVIVVIGITLLFAFTARYKKQHAVVASPHIVQKMDNNKPSTFFAPTDSLNALIQFEQEFDELFQRKAQLFDNLFSQFNQGNLSSTLKEDPKQFVFSLNLPEINLKDIHIAIQNRTLCITATKNSRSYFYYRFLLPDMADIEKITATAKNGVLKIVIPKAENLPLKSIVIKEE